jgi:hypothetical protein
MIFAPPLHRVIEHVDRRVLGAFQFVDAVSGLPITLAAKTEVRSAILIGAGPETEVSVHEGNFQIRQNRSGFQVILRAPFFDEYASTFDDPALPAETPAGRRLRLRLAVRDAGPHYLPREFEFNLPRSIARADADNVFRPAIVPLFRAPGAPVLGGWSVLRVRVTQTGTNGVRLPGVHLRVFSSPRSENDAAIGQGMTEWRGALRGEALVAIAGIARFLTGGPGVNVFETTQPVHLEATRDTNFTGDPDQFPGIPGITPGTISRRSDPPIGAGFAMNPVAPLNIRAGREATVELRMP